MARAKIKNCKENFSARHSRRFAATGGGVNASFVSLIYVSDLAKLFQKFVDVLIWQQMISAGLKKLIEANAMGLATVDKNGKPHNIAVACVKVVENKIVVTNAHMRETIKNLENNTNVSLVVWNKEWKKACVGFEIKGKAKNYTEGKWLKFVKDLPDNKGYKVVGAIVVNVKKIKRLES